MRISGALQIATLEAFKDLRVVIETALEKDRDRRYATADALAKDLQAVIERRPIGARPVGPIGRFIRWSKREPAKAAHRYIRDPMLKPSSLRPVHLLAVIFAGWMNRHHQHTIEYLREENRVLRELLGPRRLRFTDAQRRRLAIRDARDT